MNKKQTVTDTQKEIDEFQETRQEYVEKIKEKGNENLAQTIKTSTIDILANKDIVKGWVAAFPEYGKELKELNDEAKRILEKDQEYNPHRYFERNQNGTLKFRPDILAQELEKKYDFKYVEDTEQFYIYLDQYWQPRAERIIEEEVNKRLGEEYEPRYSQKTIKTIQTRGYVSTRKNSFRPSTDKIPFQNCIYDLENQEKIPHKPEYNFTHKIPWELDRNSQCPRINKFLEKVLDSEKDRELILETIGYSLLADMPYGHALILHGGGKNGKSVLLNIWKKLLGEENYKEEDLQQLEHGRFATRWLYKKLALFSDDMPATKLESGSTLKSLTGGGDTRAEIKGGDHFEFKNFATPVFACNEIPSSNDDSDGFYRRWEIVNFPYKFVENPVKDNHKKRISKDQLLEELTNEEEMKGLVNEALVRLEMLKEDGGIYYKSSAENTRHLWKTYSNPFEQFVENCLDQGLTQKDAEELEDNNQGDLTEYEYDFIAKDDLVWLIGKYCEHYDARPPTKTKVTRYLKNSSPYYVQEGRTRQLSDSSERERVYKFLRFSDEFLRFIENEEKCPECPYFFENLRARARVCKTNFQKTQDSKDTLNISLAEVVTDYIERSESEMVDEQEMIENLDFENKKVEQRLIQMIQDGELYRPRPGKIQKL